MSDASTVSLNNQLVVLIELCGNCAVACGSCGVAFNASGLTDTFRAGASACSDCADVCRATSQVAARYSGGDANAFVALLRASCVQTRLRTAGGGSALALTKLRAPRR